MMEKSEADILQAGYSIFTVKQACYSNSANNDNYSSNKCSLLQHDHDAVVVVILPVVYVDDHQQQHIQVHEYSI
jgi:hypothetical protein